MSKFKWNLRQMFLWVFIIALILPYVIALIPPSINPLIGFSVTGADIRAWLQEVDPTVEVIGGGGSGRSNYSVESEYDYTVSMRQSTNAELFAHLKKRVQEEIDAGLWGITERGSGNQSFKFVFSSGFARYRLYIWNVPISQSDQDAAEAMGERRMRIKVLKIGYTSR